MQWISCSSTALTAVVGFGLAIGSGGWGLSAAESIDAYRNQARNALGDAERGRVIFNDARAQCAQCHSVDGAPGMAGPDLGVVGSKHSRTDLIEAILKPSAAIMMGYSTTEIETNAGDEISGILTKATETHLTLAGPQRTTHRVALDEIASRRTSAASLMPEGLHAGLSIAEFIDLVTYLEQLEQPALQEQTQRGTPGDIVRLERPIAVELFLPESLEWVKPVWFEEHPVLDHRFLLAEQTRAKISLVSKEGDSFVASTFVDMSAEVFVTDTEGLLGVAMHPRFGENQKYYVMHEFMEGTQRAMIIAERRASPDLLRDSGQASRQVMRIDVGTEVHHGGGLEFGPDGYLYIGMGDAGPQEDPEGHGQDLWSLAAKLIRIDVDGRDPGLGYRIPPENPFADFRRQGRPEIFAYGLRQPWRFSFDPKNGDLWVGDVGQNRFEEVAIVKSGENHGWNVFEGFELFSTVYRKAEQRYTAPLVSFSRRHGFSITAGHIYRNGMNESFEGVYFCGDYESKRMWGIREKDGQLEMIREIGTSPDKIVAFGRDRRGGFYLIGYDVGRIFKLNFDQAWYE